MTLRRYYPVVHALGGMAYSAIVAFLPQLLPVFEDLLGVLTDNPEFALFTIPAICRPLFLALGIIGIVIGVGRLVDAVTENLDQFAASEQDDYRQAVRASSTQITAVKAVASPLPAASSIGAAALKQSAARSEKVATSVAAKNTAERLVERWDRARVKHLEVKDAYADIITDPLNALTHSVLFDVSDTRTQAFILAYSKADELFDYHDHKTRTAALVDEYENAVLLLPSRWDDALRYAEKVGSGWLPEDDRKLVATATNLIKRARNTNSEGEAQLSWKRAQDHIDQIRSFHLPVEAQGVLEQRVRGELAPAPA